MTEIKENYRQKSVEAGWDQESERSDFNTHILPAISHANRDQLYRLINLSDCSLAASSALSPNGTFTLYTQSPNATFVFCTREQYLSWAKTISSLLGSLGLSDFYSNFERFYVEGYGFNEEMLKMLNKAARQALLMQGAGDSAVYNYLEREEAEQKSVFGKILELLKIK